MDGILSIVIGIFVGLSGIFIAIILVLISNSLRSLETLKTDVKYLRESIDQIREGPILFSTNLFLAALAKEAKFWEKLYLQRADKVLIAHTIASKHIQENNTIIVDSGTTVDQIPPILRGKNVKVRAYTNNVLAAVSVLPPAEEGFECFLFEGKIDPLFGATYNVGGPGTIAKPLGPIQADQIVLAASAISFDYGPCVNVRDILNREFKNALVQKVLYDASNPRLIIAVDWTKFKKVDTNRLTQVIDQRDWQSIRATNRHILVATAPPDSLQSPIGNEARKEIQLFTDNMQREGMTIEICKLSS
jgi:DeoR/GlpR family transcriptional regulator of sugar metabolism